MNVVLTIDGRKAIPVRALPFVAGRRRDGTSHLSPDEVAGVAAHQDTFHRVEPFATFHIVDGVPRPVAFSQWGQFVIRLKALSGSLEAEERNYDESYAKWTDESIPLLPAAVFVWLDEFQTWFSRTRPLDVENIQSQEDDGEVEFRHESGDLYFSPLVPQRLCPCIREGFEELFNAPVPFESLTEALEGWFDKPKAALPAWQKYRVDTDFWPMPWDELNEEQRRSVAAQWDYKHDPAREGERTVAWYDATLNAHIWHAMDDLAPRDAAALLCRLNPHDDKQDPNIITTDETNPNDYKLLLAVFEDVAKTKPQHRTLRQWASIAKERKLKFHSWHGRYDAAMPLAETAPTQAIPAADCEVVPPDSAPMQEEAVSGEAALVNPRAGREQAEEPPTKTDAMAEELLGIVSDMKGERVTPGTVMPKLRARAGRKDSCVVDVCDEGVIWNRTRGTPEKLTDKALAGRLSRMKQKTTR